MIQDLMLKHYLETRLLYDKNISLITPNTILNLCVCYYILPLKNGDKRVEIFFAILLGFIIGYIVGGITKQFQDDEDKENGSD